VKKQEGIHMKAIVHLAVAASILGGCHNETGQKAEVPAATSERQAIAIKEEQVQRGEVLFKQNCAPCHPEGGNVTDPGRTLHGAALKRNNITTPGDIVRIMRHPISRMIRFDAATIPDKDATAIAVYVLYTFQ
jgi:cytochrome c6